MDLEDRKGGSSRSIGFPDCHWEAPPFHQKKGTILETAVVPQIILPSTTLLEYLLSRRFFFSFPSFFFFHLPSRCFRSFLSGDTTLRGLAKVSGREKLGKSRSK